MRVLVARSTYLSERHWGRPDRIVHAIVHSMRSLVHNSISALHRPHQHRWHHICAHGASEPGTMSDMPGEHISWHALYSRFEVAIGHVTVRVEETILPIELILMLYKKTYTTTFNDNDSLNVKVCLGGPPKTPRAAASVRPFGQNDRSQSFWVADTVSLCFLPSFGRSSLPLVAAKMPRLTCGPDRPIALIA